ncbi:MAG: AAA family ATPase [Chthoniobacterales bacterium]
MKHTLHDHMGGYVLAHRASRSPAAAKGGFAVTISREAGAGGSSVAHRLADYLDMRQPHDAQPWRVFDQNLVQEALQQHRMPAHLSQYLPEDATHFLPDTVEDLLGLHPSASEMVRGLSETMLGLARRGNAIIVGRGGNIVTERLPNVIHVRLVAPLAQRVRNVQELHGCPQTEAVEFIARTDRGRRRFLQQNFGTRIEDPASYDLILNTGRLGFDRAAALIGDVLLDRIRGRAKLISDEEAGFFAGAQLSAA